MVRCGLGSPSGQAQLMTRGLHRPARGRPDALRLFWRLAVRRGPGGASWGTGARRAGGGRPIEGMTVRRAVRSPGSDRMGRVCRVCRSSCVWLGPHSAGLGSAAPGLLVPQTLPISRKPAHGAQGRRQGAQSLHGLRRAWPRSRAVSARHPPAAVMSGGGTAGHPTPRALVPGGPSWAGALLMAVPAPSAPVLTMLSLCPLSHSSGCSWQL